MKSSPKRRPQKPAVVVMAREPVPGQVKTRLSPPLTSKQSASLYECFLHDTFAALTICENWKLWLAVPQGSEDYFKLHFTPGAGLLAQRGNSIGDRMHYLFAELFRKRYCRVVLTGSDLPTLPVAAFEEACAGLQQRDIDVVLGPALDGGYYLIGMKQPWRGLFRGIDWSSASVLDSTLSRAKKLKLRVKLLAPAYDIDVAEDLDRLRRDFARSPELRTRAPRTFAFIEKLAGA